LVRAIAETNAPHIVACGQQSIKLQREILASALKSMAIWHEYFSQKNFVFLKTRRPSMAFFITRLLKDESGVTDIEYGLIAALISVVCIGAMTLVGTELNAVYTSIGTHIQTALGGGG
jgi:pilus assembly protein Flp/PilA